MREEFRNLVGYQIPKSDDWRYAAVGESVATPDVNQIIERWCSLALVNAYW